MMQLRQRNQRYGVENTVHRLCGSAMNVFPFGGTYNVYTSCARLQF